MSELPQKEIIDRFRPIFCPKAIALVDPLQSMPNLGFVWLKSIVDAGFGGLFISLIHSRVNPWDESPTPVLEKSPAS